MTPFFLLSLFTCYCLSLFIIGYFTSKKKQDNSTFFIAQKKSKWYIIAFGMIGTTLSGATFISVPGKVHTSAFSYYAFILGNGIGFLTVIFILLPLYYRLSISSIYGYMGIRFGKRTQQISSILFLFSRTIGSAARLYLVTIILQRFIFDRWHIPFTVTVFICLLIICLYTIRGGLKTIIWTDTLQTFLLIVAVILSVYFIITHLHLPLKTIYHQLVNSPNTQIFFTDNLLTDNKHFLKQFFGGIFVTIATVGLDQDIMQKNLSLPNIKEAKKNMLTFVAVFLLINFLFLTIGALLKIYAEVYNLPSFTKTDYIYPTIALNYLGFGAGLMFFLGLIASTFATTDSALTALTTSFCIDILNFDTKKNASHKVRYIVHISFCILIFITCILLYHFNNEAIIDFIFIVASYTYAPLLAIYIWGIYTKYTIQENAFIIICLVCPLICYGIAYFLKYYAIYVFGFETIILNTLLCLMGLFIISKKTLKNGILISN